jgi:PAS domain S-box-containing protein
MNNAFLLGLVQNAALLMAAAFIFNMAAIRWRTRQSSLRQVSVGAALGVIGITVMLTPWTFAPGIVFDTRSVLLGISGLFFGSVSTAIAMAMTGAFRLSQGGTGALTGTAVILVSGMIGIIWRRTRRRPLAEISWKELYLFGLVVHVSMLAAIVTLPRETALRVLESIALPVLAVYPLGTALLGVLMVNRMQHERTEDALRASEDKYRHLFENASEAIFVAQDGRLVFLNPMTAVMTGYSAEELLARPFAEFIHPDDRGVIIDQHTRRIRGEELPHLSSFRIIHRDGGVRWVELNAVLIKWKENASTLNFVSDITDRRRAEDALRKRAEEYVSILSTTAEGFWMVGERGNLLDVNDSYCRMSGYSREELLTLSIPDLEAVESASQTREHIEKVIRTGFDRFESRHRMKDGRYFNVEVSATFLQNSGRFIGFIRDITERKRAEEENRALAERLQRAEKMEALGQLAGGVAHDLNNVLGVSTIYSELLQEKIPEESPLRRYVDNILSSTQKGAAIIEDLLTLARRSVITSEVINLNTVVEGFLGTPVFEKMKGHHPGVTFGTACDQNLMSIKGSPVHLEKTLMNLLANAAESIPATGEVTIRTESRYLDGTVRGYDEVREGDYAVLTVSDTGMGIPPGDREKIFEPFYTKKAMGRSGTGLGLAIVWGTVKDHQGYIDLQTEVGRGTTFTLYFPVTREELIVQQRKAPIEGYLGTGKSVLVVDDIAEQRDVAARLLTRLGYQVHAVSGGEEALEYLQGHKADILVLDMIMAPGIDGLETYRRVLAINPGQKAILVSGFSETERVREAQRLGAGAYVKKPYLMEKIGVAIRDELNR